jgi:hypothetical protein
MRLNLAMLKWGVHRLRAGQTADIRSVATREWLLCPDETATIPPAIYLDGALDRVSALSPWRDWKSEKSLIDGGPCDHAASRACLVEHVEISGAHIYRGSAKSRHGFGQERIVLSDSDRRQHLDHAHLVSNFTGSNFFGNFLLDDLPLGLIPEPGAPSIVVASNSYPHEAGYRDLLSLPRPPLLRNASVRRLVVYTDFAQNSFKASRYQELRNRMRRNFSGAASRSGPGIYLKRGATGERRILTNEADLERLLESLGFDIIEPATLTSQEIARRGLDARIVIGVEGSHLSHAIYTVADGGSFLVIQPPDRFAMAYKEFTDRVGLRFGFVVGRPDHDGFTVDLDELKQMLDKLL